VGDSTVNDWMQSQAAFVTHLVDMTKAGQIEWVRRSADPEYIYCFIDHEEITFEVSDGSENPITPFDSVHGVFASIRNKSLLWLEGLANWELLLSLLLAAEINDERYGILYEKSMNAMFDHFRPRTGGGGS
jgi:hypothetical protein